MFPKIILYILICFFMKTIIATNGNFSIIQYNQQFKTNLKTYATDNALIKFCQDIHTFGIIDLTSDRGIAVQIKIATIMKTIEAGLVHVKYQTLPSKYKNIIENFRDWIRGYIIVLPDIEFLRKNIKSLTKFPFFKINSNRKFIFFVVSCDESNDVAFMKYVGHKIWHKLRILNQIFIILNCQYDNDIIYKYNPITYNHIEQNYGKLEIYNEHNLSAVSTLENRINNFYGYPLKCILFPSVTSIVYVKKINNCSSSTKAMTSSCNEIEYYLDGVDIKMLFTLEKYMNFTIKKYVQNEESFGGYTGNGLYNGGLGLLQTIQADMIFVLYFLKSYGNNGYDGSIEPFENTFPVLQDKLCILVKKAEIIPAWTDIIYAFDPSVWLFILFSIIFFAMVWAMFKKKLQTDKIGTGNIFIFTSIAILQILIDAPLTKIRFKFLSERFLVAIFLIWGLILSGVYRSTLSTFQTEPCSFDNLDTLQDVAKSKYLIFTNSWSVANETFPSNSKDPIIRALHHKTQLYTKYANYTEVTQGRYAVLGRYGLGDIALYQKQYLSSKGDLLLHYVKQCPRNYHLTYILPKNSIFRGKINHFLSRMVQSGLPHKWLRDMKFNETHSHRHYLIQKTMNETEYYEYSITLEDIQVAFFILIIGYTISIGIFTYEMLKNDFIVKIFCERKHCIH